MAGLNPQTRAARAWRHARAQHGLVTREQLIAVGYSRHAIAHRVARGRLHRLRPGVYAVGRPEITRDGEWMAAVLSCGPEAVLSHQSAAALWRIRRESERAIHVTTPPRCDCRQADLVAHRRSALAASDVCRHRGIPVTTPVRTLIDIATHVPSGELVAAINEADKLELVDPDRLRSALDARAGQQGVGVLRQVLDRATFVLTDSELERRFLPIARRAGLPLPRTRCRVNGFRVDFYWPDLGLVVETDGLRYHRTPAQQARDRVRDQRHVAAGLTPLRFTHAQIRFEPRYVEATLRAVVRRLAEAEPFGDLSRQ
jgi:very-short-patch-repair endonuclease/predicted transcriptional regulator of viral defense system